MGFAGSGSGSGSGGGMTALGRGVGVLVGVSGRSRNRSRGGHLQLSKRLGSHRLRGEFHKSESQLVRLSGNGIQALTEERRQLRGAEVQNDADDKAQKRGDQCDPHPTQNDVLFGGSLEEDREHAPYSSHQSERAGGIGQETPYDDESSKTGPAETRQSC